MNEICRLGSHCGQGLQHFEVGRVEKSKETLVVDKTFISFIITGKLIKANNGIKIFVISYVEICLHKLY